MYCNLNAARRRPVVLGCFWPNLYYACAWTAISELSIRILAHPLDSATPLCNGTNVLAIGGQLPRDLGLWFFDPQCMKCIGCRAINSLRNLSKIEQSAAELSMIEQFVPAHLIGGSFARDRSQSWVDRSSPNLGRS